MNKPVVLFAMLAVGFSSCEEEQSPAVTTLNSQMDSVSYAIGLSVGGSIKSQKMENFNPELMANAIKDILADNAMFTDEQGNQIIQNYYSKKQQAEAEVSGREGREFLENNAKDPDVKTTASGLQYKVLKEGEGPKPVATDKVTVHYTGTLINGDVFDSSIERGEPATFPLNGVIPGWTEGLQLMNVGSKYKFFIPSDLAYGDRGAGQKITPGATLIFEVELLAIATE
jgi:FKBP-type peptidyl-prolyl cis-trans isomerase FklB